MCKIYGWVLQRLLRIPEKLKIKFWESLKQICNCQSAATACELSREAHMLNYCWVLVSCPHICRINEDILVSTVLETSWCAPLPISWSGQQKQIVTVSRMHWNTCLCSAICPYHSLCLCLLVSFTYFPSPCPPLQYLILPSSQLWVYLITDVLTGLVCV